MKLKWTLAFFSHMFAISSLFGINYHFKKYKEFQVQFAGSVYLFTHIFKQFMGYNKILWKALYCIYETELKLKTQTPFFPSSNFPPQQGLCPVRWEQDETERLPDVLHITVASFAAVEQMMCLVFRVQCEFDAAMVWKCLLDCRVNIIIFLHFERYDWLCHNLSLCLHLRNLKGHSCLPFRSWLYYDLRQSCIPKILVNEMCEMQTNMFTGCCPSHACLNLLILWNTQLHACIHCNELL